MGPTMKIPLNKIFSSASLYNPLVLPYDYTNTTKEVQTIGILHFKIHVKGVQEKISLFVINMKNTDIVQGHSRLYNTPAEEAIIKIVKIFQGWNLL